MLPAHLHRDQRGTISIISVFAVMLLTMLLGMVMNVGRQVDGKIRMQNAADAATYSGTVVLARGMNTLAFTNHLLSDVFALTAFMREARDQNSQTFVPGILAAWRNEATEFSSSPFGKFARLGSAIGQKVPLEQEMVDTYAVWSSAASERILPMLEEILADEMIPQYQRAVVEAFPDIAQTAAMETARRNGVPDLGRGEMSGALWRASGQPVGGDHELADPTFPVVDPVLGTMPNQAEYVARARDHRRRLAKVYLARWNNQSMYMFDYEGQMSQFGNLWRSFTCGYLEDLLEVEYPDRNLPMQLRDREGVPKRTCNCDRTDEAPPPGNNEYLEDNFVFVGVVYWGKLPEMMPGLYRNPSDSDQIAYAAASVFVPEPRLVWRWHGPGGGGVRIPVGGVPGDFPDITYDDQAGPPPDGEGTWSVIRQYRGQERHFRPEWKARTWNLLNQRWTCQLVPATQASLAEILQTRPPVPYAGGEDIVLPNLGGLGSRDIQRISPH